MTTPLTTDKEMMARVLAGQEHLTVEQQLRNVCESFAIVQKDNVRLYALADEQDDEIETLKAKFRNLHERLKDVLSALRESVDGK